MSILDTLKKQAAAVVDGPKSAQVAALLRQAAALLESEAPKKESFAVVKQRKSDERDARFNKFAKAIGNNKVKEREKLLNAHGFTLLSPGDNESIYCKRNTLFQLRFNGDKFSMHKGTITKQEPTHIDGLSRYLEFELKNHLK
jgi:hypothetical protein